MKPWEHGLAKNRIRIWGYQGTGGGVFKHQNGIEVVEVGDGLRLCIVLSVFVYSFGGDLQSVAKGLEPARTPPLNARRDFEGGKSKTCRGQSIMVIVNEI